MDPATIHALDQCEARSTDSIRGMVEAAKLMLTHENAAMVIPGIAAALKALSDEAGELGPSTLAVTAATAIVELARAPERSR